MRTKRRKKNNYKVGTHIRYGVTVVLLRADRLRLLVLERPVVLAKLLPVLKKNRSVDWRFSNCDLDVSARY